MQDDYVMIGNHTRKKTKILDNTMCYGTVDMFQGDNRIRIFIGDLDDYIDGLILIRNQIIIGKTPRV